MYLPPHTVIIITNYLALQKRLDLYYSAKSYGIFITIVEKLSPRKCPWGKTE